MYVTKYRNCKHKSTSTKKKTTTKMSTRTSTRKKPNRIHWYHLGWRDKISVWVYVIISHHDHIPKDTKHNYIDFKRKKNCLISVFSFLFVLFHFFFCLRQKKYEKNEKWCFCKALARQKYLMNVTDTWTNNKQTKTQPDKWCTNNNNY